MRTLVLVAGGLLIGALVIFLAIGKWKSPFNRRDLPQRLGIEIQQEANGVTYTQARAGHTLFKIHASKVVQLKQGSAMLHDVKIELYGEDGSRVDRIEGAEFEYDKQAGTAKAAGPVEITLMRPGVAPAVAPKAAPQSVGSKASPLTSAAETVARGEIHIKTSGLTFDQKSGIATTNALVNFSITQGSGSAMGATYDSQQGFLVLDRAVELKTIRGHETVQLHSQHAEFERGDQLCRMHAATANYQGGEATAGDAKILFRDDGSTERLDATSGFALTTATGGHITAPTGQMEFDDHNQPRHGRLEGGVAMDSASDVNGHHRQLHGTSPTAELEFAAGGKLHLAHLERGVAMDSEETNASAGTRSSRHWRSPVADVEFHDAGHGKLEPHTMRGLGGVVVTGESRRGQGAVVPSRLAADEVTGTFVAGSVLTTVNGTGHAIIDETAANGTRQTTSGDRIEAHFAVSAQKNSGESAIQSATVLGKVLLTETLAAKAGAPKPASLRATAGRADYAELGQWVHLTTNPRVEDGPVQLTADKVDVACASGDAFAHGNVKASWLEAAASSKGRPAKSGNPTTLALGGQGAAHMIAADAEVHQDGPNGDVTATFRGHARLWQQANSVTAPVIVLDRERQTLTARTTNASEPVLTVLVSGAGAMGASSTGGRPGSSPSVIRVRGGDLKYSDAERKAVVHNGVLNAVVAETGTATSSSNEIEVTLLPAGSASGQAQVDRMTANGHVVLTSEGRRGTGEQLVYTGATGEYVLTGTAAAPPKMSDPARGTVTGEAVTFNGRDDNVTIEGNGRKTTTRTTAPK